jgi:phage shock protein PspC (stress-responsive transcriptional regulator)
MNKVINISINGMVFTIDEQAYIRLNTYIESLKKHFAGTPGSDEIIADIEARIAELIEQRLTLSNKIVTPEITDEVIALMGTPYDIDDTAGEQYHEQQPQTDDSSPRKLRRDKQHAVIGGVCAGLANYFSVDPILVRIAFLILFFTLGSGIFIYILLWFAVPESKDTNASYTSRKLFRDSENGKLGGVCSGLGAYLGMDAVWLRLAFLVSFFVFGTGLLLYLVLWIILPKAKTASEKLQMQGKPVDVSAIEKKVRETIQEGEANVRKTLQSNSQVWGERVQGAKPVLNNLVHVMLRIIGFFIVFFCLALLTAMLAGYAFQYDEWHLLRDYVSRLIPDSAWLDGAILGIGLMVFAVLFALLSSGIKLLFVLRYKLKWIAAITLIAGITGGVLTLYSVVRYASAMDESALETVQLMDTTATDTLHLNVLHLYPLAPDSAEKRVMTTVNKHVILNETYFTDNGIVLAHALLTIKPGQDKRMKLQALKTARGSSTLQALRTAGKIESSVQHSGKNLSLNNRLAVADHEFAFQQLEYELYVPVGTVLKTDRYITQMLNRAQTEEVFAEGTTYLVTPKGLVCMDCVVTPVDEEEDEEEMEEEIDIELGVSQSESGDKEARHMRIKVSDDDLRLRKTRRAQQPAKEADTAGWSEAK